MRQVNNKMAAFFAVLFFVLFMNSARAQETQVIDRVVAVVGQNIVLQSDIEAQYLQYRLQGGIKGDAKSIRCEILEDLMFAISLSYSIHNHRIVTASWRWREFQAKS